MFRVNNKVLENFQRPAKFVRKANFISFIVIWAWLTQRFWSIFIKIRC